MLWTIAVVSLAAAPVKLAAPGLTPLHVDDAEVAFFTEHLAQQLTLQGLQVTTRKQIAAIVGMERQKELLGCDAENSSSCIAELANALGVDGIVLGSVARLDESSYRISITIVAASNGRTLATQSAKAKSKDAVLDELTQAARQLAPEVTKALRGTAPAPAPMAAGPRAPPKPMQVPAESMRIPKLRPWFWIPAASAVPFAVVGGISAGRAWQQFGLLTSSQGGAALADYTARKALADDGDSAQRVATALFIVSGVGLLTAGAMYLSGSPITPEGPPLSVVPTAGGVAVVGSWP